MTVEEEMFMSSLGNSGSTVKIHYLVVVATTLAGNELIPIVYFSDPRVKSFLIICKAGPYSHQRLALQKFSM